jgi:hypothetical protein
MDGRKVRQSRSWEFLSVKIDNHAVPDKTVPGILFRTWLGVFLGPLTVAVIPNLCLIGFLYAQPLLINAAVTLAGLPQLQSFNNVGYGLIGAYVIVYTGIAVCGFPGYRINNSLTPLCRYPRVSTSGESTGRAL